MTLPSVQPVVITTTEPDSWALAELDATLADMDSSELRSTFTLAQVRYDAAVREGRPEPLLDIFQAVVKDMAP